MTKERKTAECVICGVVTLVCTINPNEGAIEIFEQRGFGRLSEEKTKTIIEILGISEENQNIEIYTNVLKSE